jgi:hypothetical protein
MQDLIFLVLTIVFFLFGLAYVRGSVPPAVLT